MFPKNSIRTRFLIQLIIATAALIFIFSSFLYLYIQESIYTEKRDELVQFAQRVCSYDSLTEASQKNSDALLGLSVELIHIKKKLGKIDVFERKENQRTYLTLLYPFNFETKSYVKVTKDITPTKHLLAKILNSIFIINAIGFLVIIFYAIALSKMLIAPITALSKRLSNMNEHLMRPIKVEELPDEFAPLGETINRLIGRIQNFVKYQKELFIGAAHELKTPLAVMKLKNQVTMIKKREPDAYIEAMKLNNTTIDEMNKIVSDILNIGRQEGAQLEKPIKVDIIALLKRKANDFKLLAENENKALIMDFQPDVFMATLQENLLNQILQNFLQNALKFTPEGKKVLMQSHHIQEGLVIEVIDEGCGIDETIDIFAPFKRQGNKSGVGLGLFLAKSAADALGAELSLKNRTDGIDGSVARLQLSSRLCCPLPIKRKY